MITDYAHPRQVAPAPIDRMVTESVTGMEWTERQRRNIYANVKRKGQPDWVADMLAESLIGGAK